MKRKNLANELIEAMREAAVIAEDKAQPAASTGLRFSSAESRDEHHEKLKANS